MKTIFALFLAVVGLSSFTCTSAYERKINNDEERRLRWGWSKNGSDKSSFEKYFDIYKRCCGDDITPTNSLGPVGDCNCPIRGIEYFGLYKKWNYKCDTKIKAKASAVGLALSDPDFSTLVELVTIADLGDALSGKSMAGDITVFAPTNDAFVNLFKGLGLDEDADVAIQTIKGDKDLIARVTEILTMHVVPGKKLGKDLSGTENSLSKNDITVSTTRGVTVGPAPFPADDTIGAAKVANVITPNVENSNGVVHVIDAVLVLA